MGSVSPLCTSSVCPLGASAALLQFKLLPSCVQGTLQLFLQMYMITAAHEDPCFKTFNINSSSGLLKLKFRLLLFGRVFSTDCVKAGSDICSHMHALVCSYCSEISH